MRVIFTLLFSLSFQRVDTHSQLGRSAENKGLGTGWCRKAVVNTGYNHVTGYELRTATVMKMSYFVTNRVC